MLHALRTVRKRLSLGDIVVWRDWCYAPEYVEGMWRIMQLDRPDDFVLLVQKMGADAKVTGAGTI